MRETCGVSPAADDEQDVGDTETDLLGSLSRLFAFGRLCKCEDGLVAFGANVLVAVAKSVAAAVTGSASMLAEAAHSWADTGNEVFLLIANRRSRRPPDLRTRSATAGRPTSGRCSPRSGCSSPVPPCRSRTASRN